MKAKICWLLLCVLMIGCTSGPPEKPKDLITEDTYINMLVELQLVRSYGESSHVDSLVLDSLKNQIFQKYGISYERFKNSHHYYEQQPQKQKKRVAEAIERLKMDQVGQASEDSTAAPPAH